MSHLGLKSALVSPSKLSEASLSIYKASDLAALKNLIEKIASALTWLLDDKLDYLLEPYHRSEKTLVKIDNIFAVKLTVFVYTKRENRLNILFTVTGYIIDGRC